LHVVSEPGDRLRATAAPSVGTGGGADPASFDGLPELAVVVVNWNGRDDLVDCLGSLQEADYPRLRLILVDNGSQDDSVAWTRIHHPQVEVIETGSNLRWAGGNNVALRLLAAEGFAGFILLLNNDTIVPQGSLERLVAAMVADPSAWAGTPRVCYAADPARAWYDGGVIGLWTGWVRHRGIRQLTGNLSPEPSFVDYGTGCSLMIRSEVLDWVGELDENFHFYGEDTDYCLRITAAGGKILHVPRSLVLHKVSGSIGAQSPRKVWLRSRSLVQLLRKHWPRRTWPTLLVTQLVFLAGHTAYQLWHGRPATALSIWQGVFDEFRGRDF
jgi:GT2 family glycosyltransferase